jgi:hypothetical protein
MRGYPRKKQQVPRLRKIIHCADYFASLEMTRSETVGGDA